MLVRQESSQSQKDQLNVRFVQRTLNVQVKIRFGSMKDFGDHQQTHLSSMNVSTCLPAQELRPKPMILMVKDIIALLDTMETFVPSVLKIKRRKIVLNWSCIREVETINVLSVLLLG